jgi:hypothetical protein
MLWEMYLSKSRIRSRRWGKRTMSYDISPPHPGLVVCWRSLGGGGVVGITDAPPWTTIGLHDPVGVKFYLSFTRARNSGQDIQLWKYFFRMDPDLK